jgi:hypothetical protein
MSNLLLSGKNSKGVELHDGMFFDSFEKAIVGNGGIGDFNEMKKCKHILQGFMQRPQMVLKKKIQAMTVSTDLPQIWGENFVVTVDQADYDLGYEQAFQDVPAVKGKNFWSVISGHTSVTFKKVPEGGKIQVDGKTGDKSYFYVDKYGGAIGWTWESVEFREVFNMLQEAMFFRNKYFENKANIYYGVLQAAAAVNAVTPYDVATDGQLRRDIKTINEAILALTLRLKDKGYGNMANTPVIIYASRALEGRINAALRASTDAMANGFTTGAPMGAETVTGRPIRVIYTYNSNIAANRPLVVVPGITITKQDYMMPTTYTADTDYLSLNRAQSVWAAFGCGIGDSDQCQNFLLS